MPTGITYTILDLETTGLKPERDRIIDFAAIKLVDGKEVARLSQLIKPGIPIPPLITVITGIKDEDVASAPKWADFKDQAADFIQDTIIVGHNIGFDLGFLRTHGIEIGSERALDTMDLASILLPKQESYALEILCKELKFACRSTHRALADVEATGELFQHLVEKLVQLPRAVLTKMESLCQRSTWAGSGIITAALAKAGKGTKGARKKTAGSVSCPSSAGSPRSGSIPAISANTIAELFAADSPLATILPKYQLQPGQNQLAQEVWQAVTEPANALIEVGAGIGKTLAYLAPSLLWALGNKSKVVVATKSWQQEEQLIKQDIPLLTQLLQTKFANAGQFKHAIIKSNFNYLCQLKWDAWQTKAKFSKEELIFALKLTDWLATSNTGDQNEIHLNPTEQGLWPKLAASEVAEGGCLDHPHCFLKQARANAKDADLLITNQALVVRDSLNPDHLIPPQAILIIDEAHQFEAVATQHYGNAVTLERTLANVVNTQERLHSISQQNQANLFGSAELVPKITQLDSILTNLHGKLEILFGLFGMLIERFRDRSRSYRPQMIVSEQIKTSELWQKITAAASHCQDIIQEIEQKIAPLLDSSQAKDEVMSAAPLLHDTLHDFVANLNEVIRQINATLHSDKNTIAWLYLSDRDTVCLNTAPLQVAELLKEKLYPHYRSTILISATLTVGRKFDYFANQIGASEGWIFSDIPSHFNYKQAALLLIPRNLPHPTAPTAQQQLAKIIEEAIGTLGGKTLALFTSYNSLDTVYNLIAPRLKERGINVLGQGISGGRNKIFKNFIEAPEKSALLGTGSFWEALDLPGAALSCVIINKLPFDPPSDPIFKMRSGLFADAFNEYAVPRAILKFKQGFGRLIGDEQDRGIIILLDKRLETMDYGRTFLDSLPEISIVQPEIEELGETMRKFLAAPAPSLY